MITSQQKKINIIIKWLVDTREMQIFYTIINNACTCSCLLQKMFDRQLKHINVSLLLCHFLPGLRLILCQTYFNLLNVPMEMIDTTFFIIFCLHIIVNATSAQNAEAVVFLRNTNSAINIEKVLIGSTLLMNVSRTSMQV